MNYDSINTEQDYFITLPIPKCIRRNLSACLSKDTKKKTEPICKSVEGIFKNVMLTTTTCEKHIGE